MRIFLILFMLLMAAPSFARAGGQWLESTVSVNATGAKFLNVRIGRQYLLIQNNGSASITLKIDSLPGAGEGIVIPAGGNYEPLYPPYNSIYIKSSSGTQAVEIIEG